MHKTGSLLKKRLRRVRPAQMVALSFALLILLGATLLTLPISSAAHTPTGFLTCLFTATSATCVTGLIVVDTGLYWSTFGKVVIIVLIQIGGLGFMTLVSVFFVMLGKRIGLRQRMLLAQALSLDEMQGAIGMVLRILRGTAVIEGTGALILTLRFLPDYGFPRALWYGIFHAISAFCNAGFDILGDVSLGGSIIRYQKDPVVCITLMALITLGGLGGGVPIGHDAHGGLRHHPPAEPYGRDAGGVYLLNVHRRVKRLDGRRTENRDVCDRAAGCDQRRARQKPGDGHAPDDPADAGDAGAVAVPAHADAGVFRRDIPERRERLPIFAVAV